MDYQEIDKLVTPYIGNLIYVIKRELQSYAQNDSYNQQYFGGCITTYREILKIVVKQACEKSEAKE